MLSYALAIAVAISSLVLFSTAFLMSDIHRQDDFLWSGVGLFYALVLWFCARNITGAVLLGQAAAATLLVSYSWQTLKLRKAVAHPERAVEINNFSVLQAVNGLLKGNRSQPKSAVVSEPTTTPDRVTEEEIAIPDQASQATASSASVNTATTTNKNRIGAFGKLFGRKKKATITNTKLDDILEEKVGEKTSKTSSPVDPLVVLANTETVKQVETTRDEAKQTSTAQPSQPEKPTEVKVPKVLDRSPANPVKAPEVIETKEEDLVSSEIKADRPPEVVESEKISSKEPPANTTNQEQVEIKTDRAPEVVAPEKISSNEPPANTTKTNQEQAEIKVDNSSMPTETNEETEETKPVGKPSSLDSLETVEVAEVLDAVPDDSSSNRDSDRGNIIEVTTTEISITTEVKEIEPDRDEKADSN